MKFLAVQCLGFQSPWEGGVWSGKNRSPLLGVRKEEHVQNSTVLCSIPWVWVSCFSVGSGFLSVYFM